MTINIFFKTFIIRIELFFIDLCLKLVNFVLKLMGVKTKRLLEVHK